MSNLALETPHDEYYELPALPGFRSTLARPSSAKNQSLSFVNGYMLVRPPPHHASYSGTQSGGRPPGSRPTTAPVSPTREVLDSTDVTGRYSFSRRKADRENCNIALPFCPHSKLPAFLEHDRRVLLFKAYYEEDVLQSAIEEKRIHTCELYFYVEDGTMEIIETKQENSGIVQGRFLRRSRVAKPGGSSSHESYGIDDLKIGSQVVIYSRTFHIASCNESTRGYVMDHHGWTTNDLSSLPLPRDRFAESNKAKMRRESGVVGVDRKRKMNDLKQVMESMLGKESSMTDRGKFLESGTDALCFHVLWDDRERLYGDVQYFRLFYYLADDTVEIMRAQSKNNDGRDTFPKLLKRSKLPINGRVSSQSCYKWRDLAIGQTVNVFGREMLIARCDSFTRQHYKYHGITLQEDIPLTRDKKVDVKRVIPPYNGFGTEEDSLRSCTGSLNPPPPKRDIVQNRKSGVVLRFNAQLVSATPDDGERRFVIQFFLEDETVAIREPPVQNSGIMGGNFLRRQAIKKNDGSWYTAKDFFVGNKLLLIGHQFLILNADEYTYRFQEGENKMFPFSHFVRLHEMLSAKQDEIKAYFISNYGGNGLITIECVRHCLSQIDGLDLNKQEVLTIWRKLDRKGKGKIPFRKFLTLCQKPAF